VKRSIEVARILAEVLPKPEAAAEDSAQADPAAAGVPQAEQGGPAPPAAPTEEQHPPDGPAR